MCIQSQTKTEYQDFIRDYQVKLEMTGQILLVIESMEHYKRVDKKFADKLESLYGISTYFDKGYAPTIRFTKRVEWSTVRPELHVRCYEGITWECIKQELIRVDWGKYILETKVKLDNFDAEVEKLQKLRDFITELDIKNYSLYRVTSDLDFAIKSGR